MDLFLKKNFPFHRNHLLNIVTHSVVYATNILTKTANVKKKWAIGKRPFQQPT